MMNKMHQSENYKCNMDLENWTKEMGLSSMLKSSDVLNKLCSPDRKVIWGPIIRRIRPASEIEQIRKNLAIKNAQQKLQQNERLLREEELLSIKERDFEQAQKQLSILNCKSQVIVQRTKDLRQKTMLLCCKEEDLNKKAQMCEELCEVACIFKQPLGDGSADAPDRDVEICQKEVSECEAQFHELHKLYKVKDFNKQTLHKEREFLMTFVKNRMKNFSAASIWHMLLNSMIKLIGECISIQNCLRNEPENLQIVKEHISLEMQKFMKLQLELLNTNHNLQQELSQRTSDSIVLLEKTEEVLQEKLHGEHFNKTFLESGEIKKWLELRVRCSELDIINKILRHEIKISSLDLEALNSQECRAMELRKQIEEQQHNIMAYYTWCMESYANQPKAYEKWNHDIFNMVNVITTSDILNASHVNGSIKGLQGSFEQELKAFMELPLEILKDNSLPLRLLPRSMQLLECHKFGDMAQFHELADVLTVPDAVMSTTPQYILLQALEKKLYLRNLKIIQQDIDNMSNSLEILDISSLKVIENATVTSVAETRSAIEKAIEKNKQKIGDAENTCRAWREHPLRFAVPEKMQVEDESLKQWQNKYDTSLATLTELKN